MFNNENYYWLKQLLPRATKLFVVKIENNWISVKRIMTALRPYKTKKK